MNKQLRLFIAIALPKDVKLALADCEQQLKTQFPKGVVRWVKPDNMHLTLRFLGETDEAKISDIAKQLDQISTTSNPFKLQLNQTGSFPDNNKPRVLWVSLQGEMARLNHLKQSIDQVLLPLGWPLETRRYNPHLTIGRIKDRQIAAKVQWGSVVDQVHFMVTAVSLYQSELTPNGPLYTRRHKTKLAT